MKKRKESTYHKLIAKFAKVLWTEQYFKEVALLKSNGTAIETIRILTDTNIVYLNMTRSHPIEIF